MLSRGYAFAYSLLSLSPEAEYSNNLDLDVVTSRVFGAMPIEDRLQFTIPLVESFCDRLGPRTIEYLPVRQNRLSVSTKEQLEQELKARKCVITLGDDCQLQRTVVICVLEIMNEDEQLLVRIAAGKGGELIPDVVLPATKLREHESTDVAAKRLVSEELPDLGGTMHFDTSRAETKEMKSKLGIPTVYLKTIYLVRLRSAMGTTDSDKKIISSSTSVTRKGSLIWQGPMDRKLASEILSEVQPVEVSTRDDKRRLYAWLHREDFLKLSACVAKDETFKQWLANYLRIEQADSGNQRPGRLDLNPQAAGAVDCFNI